MTTTKTDAQSVASVIDKELDSMKAFEHFTFEKFCSFFPLKYRKNKKLPDLYEIYKSQREEVKDGVQMLIRSVYPPGPPKQTTVSGMPIDEAIMSMEHVTAHLSSENEKLEKQLDIVIAELEKYDRTIGTLKVQKSMTVEDIKVLKTVEGLLQQIKEGE